MNTENKTKKYKISKLVIISIILTLLSYVFLDYINVKQVYASQYREGYSNNIDNYPGYRELIDNLKANHPNWNFTIFYTGLDWDQVIKNETTGCHGRNVVPASRPSAWKCPSCGETPRGGSSWRCASEAAVSYYMDPRNWLNDSYIFQFENLSFNGDIQTVEGVEKIIADMYYMQGDQIVYTNTNGDDEVIDKSYAQVIMEAAEEAGISPYHLASRLRQEQGGGSRPGSTATGTYPGYVGYYNYLNIKASGSTDSQVIANGLQHAADNGWTDPEISIKEGTKVLASNYINDGQDTLYLQKFDVDGSDGTLYYFQYMQNASAAVTESVNVRDTYEELGLIDSSIEFVIPVYENMPDTICIEPCDSTVVTQNIKVKGTNVNIRNGASTSSSIIATVNTGDNLLRIEIATSTNGGYYWDKVVLPDGTKGYMVRNYIVEAPDITNCNEQVVANTTVNLRNGPGTAGTTVITTLIKGQMLTRIATGEYNDVNGYNWDRVQLTDGRQGYMVSDYIDKVGEGNNNPGNTNTTEIIKVICNSGLKVREQPGTDSNVLTYLDQNDVLTRIQANASNANGYIWDKIVTSEGIEGYIARGDSREDYIEVIQSGNNNNNKDITLGDCNGDTNINSGDLLVMKRHLIGTNVITDSKKLTAMDINKDGIINSGDLFLLKKHLLGTYTIN